MPPSLNQSERRILTCLLTQRTVFPGPTFHLGTVIVFSHNLLHPFLKKTKNSLSLSVVHSVHCLFHSVFTLLYYSLMYHSLYDQFRLFGCYSKSLCSQVTRFCQNDNSHAKIKKNKNFRSKTKCNATQLQTVNKKAFSIIMQY